MNFIVITKNNRARIMSAAFFKKHGPSRGWMQTYSVTLKNDRHEFTRTPTTYADLKPRVAKYNKAAAAYFGGATYKAMRKAFEQSQKESAA